MNMTTPTNEEVRRQFEAWAVDRRMAVERDERHGYYLDDATQDAWLGYQAALSSPAVVALVEALQNFADLAQLFDDEMRGGTMPMDDDDPIMQWPRVNRNYELKVGHLRKARAALAACTPAKSEKR
jgi:hypothetical protein